MAEKKKPDVQDPGVSDGTETTTATQILISAKDKIFPPSPGVLTNEEADEPTREFTTPPAANAKKDRFQTGSSHKTEIENARTKVLEDEPPAPNENALRPSRLRLALAFLLFGNMFVFAGINIYQIFSVQSALPFSYAPQGDRLIITGVRQGFEDKFQAGDQIISVDGVEADPVNIKRLDNLTIDAPGENRTILITREENGRRQTSKIETTSVAPPLGFRLNRVLYEVLLRTIFLVTGILIFLFKPNDKQAFLLTLIFISALASEPLSIIKDLPAPFFLVRFVGLLIISFCAALFLHFCLIFPERSNLLRRFPNLERLIYLPALLVILPSRFLLVLQFAGHSILPTFSAVTWLQNVGRITYDLYFVVGLVVLISTYRRSGKAARRKLQVSVAGLLCSCTPFLLNGLILTPLLQIFEIRNAWQEWMPFIAAAPLLLTPPVAAYAIVWDKVIPISFVIRRGLQYLFAKNALRLFLILPILGVVWNVAANSNRTLSEILLQNSPSFYFFVLLAVGLILLNRFRLREWIDKKFFREQYDQERVLRELIEAVKESDSLPKLARLVSSKIQFALHPENVYLFFREDEAHHSADFSLGYSANREESGGGEGDGIKLKLNAASPLLGFIERERGTIELPTGKIDALSDREKRWLREINSNLLVPMHGTDGKLVGFFSLGEKMSHVAYTTRDKELLETLAHQIALVHENLSLKTRVLREQKIKTEVLSRFDEGNVNLLKECPRCGKCYDRSADKCVDDDSELTFTLPVERSVENRYRLEKLLGKGGMGAVYEARDLRLNRTVALKILSGAMFGNREALKRFEREAQSAGRLQHPNIVTVYDYGALSTEGAFLVMELVRGESFADVLRREKTLDEKTVKSWFAQILDGVEAAHKSGVVHRDLKPDNIFVTKDESGAARLSILDFGLARLNEVEIAAENITTPGMIMGTFGYMPPEQLKGEPVDERSDLFAVAVMIYESLHGSKPFPGKSYHELLMSMNEKIDFGKNDFPADFFERGLAYAPDNRFQTAGGMKKALANF